MMKILIIGVLLVISYPAY
ncbi:type I toxin-antitoxin system Ibs family toxin [Escherichia coli]|nr:type I toxin-antitoxin system Ibs family toxin [Escherichia coli]